MNHELKVPQTQKHDRFVDILFPLNNFQTNIGWNQRTNFRVISTHRYIMEENFGQFPERGLAWIIGVACRRSPTRSSEEDLGRFAFNRDPRPTYTAACVPCRYEFIVYSEWPLVHISKLIVPAVNYSACTPATAAAVPRVRFALQVPFRGARVHFAVLYPLPGKK